MFRDSCYGPSHRFLRFAGLPICPPCPPHDIIGKNNSAILLHAVLAKNTKSALGGNNLADLKSVFLSVRMPFPKRKQASRMSLGTVVWLRVLL